MGWSGFRASSVLNEPLHQMLPLRTSQSHTVSAVASRHQVKALFAQAQRLVLAAQLQLRHGLAAQAFCALRWATSRVRGWVSITTSVPRAKPSGVTSGAQA